MNINKVLVTGSEGFVGKHLCNHLSKNGINVVSGDKNEDNKFDVTDIDHFQSVEDVEAIIHLAAKANVVYSYKNTYSTYHTNLLGALNILEFARLRNIRKLIFVSTYVYGEPKYLPVDEKHPINPHSPYHKSKLLAEYICENYSHDLGIDIVTLRPFYIYGPNSRYSFISSAIRQIKENGKVLLSGDHTQRDFLFINDFINLLTIILNKFPRGYNVYNIGSGTSHTLKEVTEIIAKLMNKKITIDYDNESRPGDVIYMKADISKVSTSFNWRPLVDINEGLKLTIQNSQFVE
jgi:nucleoside-diphosphate-sugar epimerase